MRRLMCCCALGLLACGQPPTDEPIRTLDCDVDFVASTTEHAPRDEGVQALAAREFWRPGPYHVWSSAPADACPVHPIIPANDAHGDVPMHLHFPANGDPSETGEVSVAQGSWPIVVFIHSNLDRFEDDGSCVSIFERYRSLHAHWASWGFVVASVDNTAQNCRRDGQNIYERSTLQLEAVDALAALSSDPDSPFHERIDTSRVVFAGHSRGGGSSLLSANEASYPVAGVIGLQPLDMTGFGDPKLDVPYIGFVAGSDVDLNYPHVEPTEEVLRDAYTLVTIYGGIHAWTGDTIPQEPDDEPLIEQSEQHDTTQYYSTAFLSNVVGLADGSANSEHTRLDTEDILFAHDGAHVVRDEGLSSRGVATRWRAPDEPATLIDGFDKVDESTNALGGENDNVSLENAREVYTYAPNEPSPSTRLRKASSLLLTPRAGESGVWRTTFGEDGLTIGAGATLQARVKGADGEAKPTSVALTLVSDEGERRVELGPEHIGPEAMTNRYTQLVIALEEDSLEAIEIEVAGGKLFVDELRVVASGE